MNCGILEQKWMGKISTLLCMDFHELFHGLSDTITYISVYMSVFHFLNLVIF